MSDYRRYRVPGGTYFFTVVMFRRRRILTSPLCRHCLREAITEVRQEWPFRQVAIVLLPDHLHAVWELPRGDDRYSLRWQKIKEKFTQNFLDHGGTELRVSRSRNKKGERGIWQRRFWEHTCMDEAEVKRCVDYLHWNPVKHGLVKRVVDWRWSSFHRFVQLGEYDALWGATNPTPGFEMPE